MVSSPFLRLPRELRDLILDHALSDEDQSPDFELATSDCKTKNLTVASVGGAWNVHYAGTAPTATYLNVMLCNRQLRTEMQDLLQSAQKRKGIPAKLTVLMAYPSLRPTWTYVPQPPSKTNALDILVKIDSMYHPALITRGSDSAMMTAVFETLKRYIHRGPHLARASSLHQPLHLETVRLTLAPPMPFGDLTFFYGNPTQQLESLFNDFRALLSRLGRSGIPFGSIGAFEVRVEGKEWHRIPVTSDIWDEDDHVFFKNGGYEWDAGD